MQWWYLIEEALMLCGIIALFAAPVVVGALIAWQWKYSLGRAMLISACLGEVGLTMLCAYVYYYAEYGTSIALLIWLVGSATLWSACGLVMAIAHWGRGRTKTKQLASMNNVYES